MKLSYQRALWAAYTLLEVFCDDGEDHKLWFILDEMNPFVFKDRVCADPAVWQSWTECCKVVNDNGYLTFEQIMTVLVDFLKINEDEYSCFEEEGGNYSADDVIRSISTYVENGRWNEILNKVYNFTDS